MPTLPPDALQAAADTRSIHMPSVRQRPPSVLSPSPVGPDRPDHGGRRGEHVEPGCAHHPQRQRHFREVRVAGRAGVGGPTRSSSGMTSHPPSAAVSASHR